MLPKNGRYRLTKEAQQFLYQATAMYLQHSRWDYPTPLRKVLLEIFRDQWIAQYPDSESQYRMLAKRAAASASFLFLEERNRDSDAV